MTALKIFGFKNQSGIIGRDVSTFYQNPKDRKILFNCKYKNISVLKCNHTYHKKCLSPWIKNNPLCPYCLTIIYVKILISL